MDYIQINNQYIDDINKLEKQIQKKPILKNKYLYKYYSLSPATLNTVTEGNLYFASPPQFNDPFDGLCNFDIDFNYIIFNRYLERNNIKYTKAEKDLKFIKELKRINNIKERGINKFYEEARSQYRIFCTSATNNNTLMWSHYGDSHKGICLGFKTSVGNNSNYLKFKNDDKNLVKVNALPINYIRKNASIPSYNRYREDDSFLFQQFLNKTDDWKYEEEYRFIFNTNNNNANFVKIELSQLDKIIFGLNTTLETINDTINKIEKINSNKITYSKMEQKNNTYELKEGSIN